MLTICAKEFSRLELPHLVYYFSVVVFFSSALVLNWLLFSHCTYTSTVPVLWDFNNAEIIKHILLVLCFYCYSRQ